MGIDRDHRTGDHQHQHHVGLALPVRGQQVDHEQREQRQYRGDGQVARAETHAVAQVDPDHHRIDGQRALAAHHQAEAGAGVVIDHPKNPPDRVMAGPAGNGQAQADGNQGEDDDVDDHRQVDVEILPRQATGHGDIDQRATGHDDA